jgi:hypothetical protein
MTRHVSKEQAERFILNPKRWDDGEQSEAKAQGDGNAFYWAQLIKLESLGFKIDGGSASSIAKICTPSRAVAVTLCFMGMLDHIMWCGRTQRWGIEFWGSPDYFQAISLLDRICAGALAHKGGQDGSCIMERTQAIFFYFDRCEALETEDELIFYEKILPGMREIAGQLKASTVHHVGFHRKIGRPVPSSSNSELEQLRQESEQRRRVFDSHVRRNPAWEKVWVSLATDNLAYRLEIDEQVAKDILRLILADAVTHNEEPRIDHASYKYATQEILYGLSCPLNEPGPRKFFHELLPAVLKELGPIT